MKLQVVVDTPHPAEAMIGALTDFSERRPAIWPFLDRRSYQVHSLGRAEAEVTEGTMSPVGRFWARERYDWSKPGVVSWTVQESNFCHAGTTVTARVEPRDGGSRVHLDWERRPKGWRGAMFALTMKPAARVFLARSISGVRI